MATALVLIVLVGTILLLASCESTAQCITPTVVDSKTPSRGSAMMSAVIPSTCFSAKTRTWAVFQFTPLSASEYTFATSGSSSLYFDTVMEIYDKAAVTCNGTINKPALVCDDDMESFAIGFTGSYSRTIVPLVASQTVIVFVGWFDTSAAGSDTSSITLSILRQGDTWHPTKAPTRAPTFSPKAKTPTRPSPPTKRAPTKPVPVTRSPTLRYEEFPNAPCKETSIGSDPMTGPSYLRSFQSSPTNTTTRWFVFECLHQGNSIRLGKVFRFTAPFAGQFLVEVTSPHLVEVREGSCLNTSRSSVAGSCSSTLVLNAFMAGQSFDLIVFRAEPSSWFSSFGLTISNFVSPVQTVSPTRSKEIGATCFGQSSIPFVDLSNETLPYFRKDSTTALGFQMTNLPRCVGPRSRPVMVYRFQARVAGLYTFDTTQTRGNAVDTVMEMVTTNRCESLSCNDDAAVNSFRSTVEAYLQIKQAVYVIVSGYQPVSVSFILSVHRNSPSSAPTESPSIAWIPSEPECTGFSSITSLNTVYSGTTILQRRRKLMCNSVLARTAVFRFTFPEEEQGDEDAVNWFKFHVTSAQDTVLEIRKDTCLSTPISCNNDDSSSLVASIRKGEVVYVLVAGLGGVQTNFTLTVTASTPPPTFTPSTPPLTDDCLLPVIPTGSFPVTLAVTPSNSSLPVQTLSCGFNRPARVFQFKAPFKGKFKFFTLSSLSSPSDLIKRPIGGAEGDVGDTVVEIRKGGCVNDYCPFASGGEPCPEDMFQVLGCNDDNSETGSLLSSVVVDLNQDEEVFVLVQELSREASIQVSLTIQQEPTWKDRLTFEPEVVTMRSSAVNALIVRNTAVNSNVQQSVPTFHHGDQLLTGKSGQVFLVEPKKTGYYQLHLISKLTSSDMMHLLSAVIVDSSDNSVLWSSSSSDTFLKFKLVNQQAVYIVVFAQFVEPLWYSLRLASTLPGQVPTASLCSLLPESAANLGQETQVLVSVDTRRTLRCMSALQSIQGGTANLYATGVTVFRAPKADVFWFSSVDASSVVALEVYRTPLADNCSIEERPLVCGLAAIPQAMEMAENEIVVILVLGDDRTSGIQTIRVDTEESFQQLRDGSKTSAPTMFNSTVCAPTLLVVPQQASGPGDVYLPSLTSLKPVAGRPIVLNQTKVSCAPPTTIPKQRAVYIFQAPETSTYLFQTFNLSSGTDTVLEVRTGKNCSIVVAPTSVLGCNDDRSYDDLSSQVLVQLSARQTITVFVQWTKVTTNATAVGDDGYLLVDFYPSRRSTAPTISPSMSPLLSIPSTSPTTKLVVCSKVPLAKCQQYPKICKKNRKRKQCIAIGK